MQKAYATPMTGAAATAAATERFRQRIAAPDPGHFRPLQDLWASSIGLGTYLGEADDATDARYAEAIRAALARGCNVLDTAINYRGQRSERTIGAALQQLIADGAITREEVILCTKGGYLVEPILDAGLAAPEEIASGCHCLAPAYLDHALRTSLANLRVQTIDVYYLHNPEQQLDEVGREAFLARMEAAFTLLEQRVHSGAIRYYGIATWHGLRRHPKAKDALSLATLAALAARVGGPAHHFRVIQLPYNLAMPEAFAFANQPINGQPLTALAAAQRLELSVVCSASLLQGQLSGLPDNLGSYIPGLSTSAQRAVQFARSTPGITTALVGMQRAAHVEDVLELARLPVMPAEQLARLFDRTRRGT